jgi:multiple sugar transport system substrate-binding protein
MKERPGADLTAKKGFGRNLMDEEGPMEKKSKLGDDLGKGFNHRTLGRRKFLMASGGAALAAAGSVAMPYIANAQQTTLRFWTTQRGTGQRKAYQKIMSAFEKAHPQFKVNFEIYGEEEAIPKLAAARAGGSIPDVISHLPAPFAIQLFDEGLLTPMDEVLEAIGEDDFFPNGLELYKDAKTGHYVALCIANGSTPGSLWYRKDLLADAGLDVPKYWDEFLVAAKKMTKRGIYGTIYPFGKTSMGSVLALQTVWQAGGNIVDPDLNVTFNTDETVAALEFAKEMSEFSPGASASYSYSETINGFVSGRAATAPYSARVLTNVKNDNPKIADHISLMPYPYRREGKQQLYSDFQALVMPKGGASAEGALLFANWLFKKDQLVTFLHATPGHNLPDVKSIAESKEFRGHPLLVKYANELDTLFEVTLEARNLLKETPMHPINRRAGHVFGARAIVETYHDVIVGGMPPKEAAARGQDRIAAVMKG